MSAIGSIPLNAPEGSYAVINTQSKWDDTIAGNITLTTNGAANKEDLRLGHISFKTKYGESISIG